MPIVWTESLTLRLVTLYGKHECLRNPFHRNFKNKLCRYKAYKEIADSMNVSGLTVCDCIKRITYVKSQYCTELSRIGAAISCEKFYKPTASWFPIIHKLFFPFVATCTYTNNFCEVHVDALLLQNALYKGGCYETADFCPRDISTFPIRHHLNFISRFVCEDKPDTLGNYDRTHDQLTRSEFVEAKTLNEKCNCPYAICHCDDPYKAIKPRIRPKKPGKLFHSTRLEGEEVVASQTAQLPDCTNYLRPQKVTRNDVGNNTRRCIGTEHATQTDASYFKTACTTCQVCMAEEIPLNLANILTKADLSNPIEKDIKGEGKTDEFDMFGKSIAFQLRNISFEVAIKLEKRIQDLIAQERLDSIKSKRSDCCTTSSCSECKVLRKGMVCSCGLPVIMIEGDSSCDFNCKQRK